MNWIQKLLPPKITEKNSKISNRSSIPEALWHKCSGCQELIYSLEFEKNQCVCTQCGFHHALGARDRLLRLFDSDSSIEIASHIIGKDPLKFKDSKSYVDRLKSAKQTSGESEGLIVFSGRLSTISVTAAAFEYRFIGGSMGSAVGERFVQAVSHAIEYQQPFLCFTASGGARMQEGLISLMQMAKTTVALTQLAHAGLPFINILTNPTMGGVSASFAMIADIVIAEPGALIGFAGQRVIEQTVREKLPEGFQSSNFLMEKGAIDRIIDRRDLNHELAHMLSILMGTILVRSP